MDMEWNGVDRRNRQLRAKVEALLHRFTRKDEPHGGSKGGVLHELQVHQLELEVQNETLRQTQNILEESRDRYRDLFDFAPLGYLTLTREATIAEINLTGAALLGLERKKLLRRRFASFVAPDDLERWQHHFQHLLQYGGQQHHQLVIKRGDGTLLHVHLDSLRLEGGEHAGTLRIALTDITTQQRAEEALRIAAIAFESQEGMIVTDAQGTILRVNQAFVRRCGYRTDELVGNTAALFKSGRHDTPFYQQLWSHLQESGHWQGVTWNRHADGKIYAVWLTISAVRAPDGKITHYVATYSDITQNREAEAEMHRLAYYDPLTYLPNRRLLHDRLGQALASSARTGRYGAVLFLDLDNFKILNDTRGHDIGDELLTAVARRMEACVRESDTISLLGDNVSRLGGDEFVVVLEELSEEVEEALFQAELVGEKLQEALAQPYDLKGHDFHCTASLGITLFCGHEHPIESLLKQADQALYQAKGAGRNTLRVYDPAMQAALERHNTLERELRQALNRHQLQLHYQPQCDSHRRIIGAEALLRWTHPEYGVVAPELFTSLAEESDLIVTIGRWVLQTVTSQLKMWSAESATQQLYLSVNIGARQFRHPGFIQELQTLLHESGVNPSYLVIELAESLKIYDLPETLDKMRALVALGVTVSMDNFGTGYASLTQLSRLPLEQLKIDPSLIHKLGTAGDNVNSDGDVIIKALLSMGQALGLRIIADGVESEAQLALLQQLGCPFYQGELISGPLPAAELTALLC